MSLCAIPFAVSIEEVKLAFGSKDRDLLEKIKTAGLYDHYADQSDDFPDPKDKYDLDQVLEDIVFRYIRREDRKLKTSFFGLIKSKGGSGLDENIAHSYGYALLVMCDYFGTQLLPHCDGFYWGRNFKTAADIMDEMGCRIDMSDMFEPHEVFDIPRIKDFPAIKSFTRQEIGHINEVMNKVEIDESAVDIDSEDFDEVQEMLKDLRDSFRYCKENNIEMVVFTH
jgi:hypothetical protein